MWPDGMRAAAAFTFDFDAEEVWIGEDPANADRQVTLGLLEKHGFAYSSNLMDDLRPYRHEGKQLVELPIQWILDDAAHFWFDGRESWTRRISTPGEVREIWEAEFAGIRDLGGAFVLTMHPQIIGRPSRLALLDGFIAHVRRDTDV